MNDESLRTVFDYHERTKHHVKRYARSLGYLDWDTQPIPFRRFEGATSISLDEAPPSMELAYDALFSGGPLQPRPLDRASLSQFFYDSLALSAWKQVPGSRWSLRVNPSSGNLHPTEGYIISGTIPGVLDRPAVSHYAPFENAIEVRRELTPETWAVLSAGLPAGAFFAVLTSIHWRESWKYGERAYRYCQHDAGHAIAALCMSARVLGWDCWLLERQSDDAIVRLLGLDAQSGVEAEHPDCLLLVTPTGAVTPAAALTFALPADTVNAIAALPLSGTPNRLSHDHHAWPIIDDVSRAAAKTESEADAFELERHSPEEAKAARSVSARQIIRQRRSAVAMDGHTSISRDAFYHMLMRVMPDVARPPFACWPWRPAVHLALFVHRVDGLPRGLYFLARDGRDVGWIRDRLKVQFAWRTPEGCPKELPLFLLHEGDFGQVSNAVSCHQDIAEDGAFSLGMLAVYESRLRDHGAWYYRRLFWETGMIGQVLYLEAEAAGVRATGIGCFFDDAMHELLGVRDRSLQSLYHFTVGGPVEDPRLQTLPAYFHLSHREKRG